MASDRARAVVGLRVRGASWVEVVRVLQLRDVQQAKELFEEGLAGDDLASADERRTHRVTEQQRIMSLLNSVWDKANDPTDPEHLPAARTALQLIDRHSKLLGLDAPTEVVVHNPTQTEIDAWVVSVLQANAVQQVEEADVTLSIEATDE